MLVVGPPLVGPSLGALVAARHRAMLANVIYDIYSDVAMETGRVTNPLVVAAARFAERVQYHASDLTIVLSEGFKRKLVERGLRADKIVVVPVWLDSGEIRPLPRDNAWRREQGIPLDKFVVLYAGTIGVVSGAQVVAEAAYLLRKKNDILFLFVGDGEVKTRVEARAGELGLENMRFLPFQPRSRLAELQASGDVGLVTLSPGKGRTSVPSKVLGYMAAGRPTIAAVDADSDTALEIMTYNTGMVVPPNDPKAIADATVALLCKKDLRRKLGETARRQFETRYAKEKVLELYARTLKDLLE